VVILRLRGCTVGDHLVKGNDDEPVLQEILKEMMVQLAFKDGNRRLASWAFWLLHRRDSAVRILVVRLDFSDSLIVELQL